MSSAETSGLNCISILLLCTSRISGHDIAAPWKSTVRLGRGKVYRTSGAVRDCRNVAINDQLTEMNCSLPAYLTFPVKFIGASDGIVRYFLSIALKT